MKRKLSVILEGEEKYVRMAYLSIIASKHVNGVAKLHTELLKQNLFHDFNELYPKKFINITNGITPRRWLLACNPLLSNLIDKKIGRGIWCNNLELMKGLESLADKESFQNEFMQIKYSNKKKFSDYISQTMGIIINPNSLFDVQIKRLHEYKRQHLNLLYILTLYHRLLNDEKFEEEKSNALLLL